MIRLSMNVVSASLSLLKIIGTEGVTPYDELHSLYRISGIDVDDLLEMLITCKVVAMYDDSLILMESGKIILSNKKDEYDRCIRIFLNEYILHTEPIWSKRIPYGRGEASTFMTKDEKSCFFEAGLLSDEPDYDVVMWWDNLSEVIRKKVDLAKSQIGRSGEKYTIAYERARVGRKPSWKSIDSNLLGYDIMSIASSEDNTPLLIEVKATSDDIEHAFFHISANEWRVANHAPKYAFYLWYLCRNKKHLAIIEPDEMKVHMPENKANGEWESVKIPFKSFSEMFTEWGGDI